MLNLRIANSHDLDNLAQLYRETVLAIAPQKYNPEQVQAWANAPLDRANFREFILGAETHILEDGAGIVGFAGLDPGGHFTSLYIRHDRTRQGLGRELILLIIQQARTRGIKRLYGEASEFSVGLFVKMGFKISATEYSLYGGVMFYRYFVEMEL